MKELKRLIIQMIMVLMRIFPIKNNKIVFSSYHGTSYSCNPKFISEELQRNPEGGKLDIVWILPKGYAVPEGIRTAREKSLKGLYELATARVWVDNCRKSIWTVKRKGQYYIQTWHAGISYKTGEGMSEDVLPAEYIRSAIHDSEIADLFLSNSRWLTQLYRKFYWYQGEVLEKGLPREDIFCKDREEIKKKICEHYKVDEDTCFVLYAPTFRNSGDLSVYDIDYYRLINQLETDGHSWKVIVRLHPNIQQKQGLIEYNDQVLNGSEWPEINELIMASELFISDYSSCMFDAMLAGDRVIIYASDIEEYGKERGYVFKWSEIPFSVAVNNDELCDLVEHFDITEYEKRVHDFKEYCGIYEIGGGAVAASNYILKNWIKRS